VANELILYLACASNPTDTSCPFVLPVLSPALAGSKGAKSKGVSVGKGW